MDKYEWDQKHQDFVPPQAVIEETIRIGHCWSFAGSNGHIGIQLVTPITLSQVTLYYPNARQILPKELRQAPKNILIWALLQKEWLPMLGGELPVRPMSDFMRKDRKAPSHGAGGVFVAVGSIAYRPEDGTKQVFTLSELLASKCNAIVMEVVDNWGGNETCIYRIAVHGAE
ncbi:SUN domain-containing protein 3 [Stygiomarasmius scandens]|uniref:SUN domain-containing protein 3 n=1 Tax=Marasmiellus scandens TaxID=2682957 RepID=A0ABR1IP34_9AGAR